jgi:hypothetical protein
MELAVAVRHPEAVQWQIARTVAKHLLPVVGYNFFNQIGNVRRGDVWLADRCHAAIWGSAPAIGLSGARKAGIGNPRAWRD